MKLLKKIGLLSLTVFVLIIAVGCSPENQANSDRDESVEQSNGIVYETPAQCVLIDMNKDDPSNEQIRFSFDELGRVSQCRYNIDEHEIYLNYTYTSSTVQILAFSDSIVAADETFDLPGDFDPNINFIEYNGYYFRGYQFT